MPHFSQMHPVPDHKPREPFIGLPDQMATRSMPERTETSILIERVEKLISLLGPPSAIIITGKQAIEDYEQLVLRKAR